MERKPCPYFDACSETGTLACRDTLSTGSPDTLATQQVEQFWSSLGDPETDPRPCWARASLVLGISPCPAETS